MLVNPLDKLKKERFKTKLLQKNNPIQETAGIDIVSSTVCPVCGGDMKVCMSIEDQKIRTCIACSVSVPYVGD